MLVLVVKNLEKKQQLYLICEYHVRREESGNTAIIFIFLSSRFSVFLLSIYSSSPFSVLLGFKVSVGKHAARVMKLNQISLVFISVIFNVRYTRNRHPVQSSSCNLLILSIPFCSICSGVRPFGVSLLVAGYDDKGPQLYQVYYLPLVPMCSLVSLCPLLLLWCI